MADSKISALTATTTLLSTDELAVATSGVSKKIAGSTLPGFEIGYDQITAPVNITATSANGDTIITCGAHTFDGSPVIAEFFAPYGVQGGTVLLLRLCEGASNLGRIYDSRNASGSQQGSVCGKIRFTPSVGSHTYTIKGQVATGTGQIGAGVPTGDDYVPAFVRFTRV